MDSVPFMHRHVLAVVNSERRPGPIRLLDLGCGDGRLLSLLQRELCDTELFGLDVSDPGVQREGFLDAARARLGGFTVARASW